MLSVERTSRAAPTFLRGGGGEAFLRSMPSDACVAFVDLHLASLRPVFLVEILVLSGQQLFLQCLLQCQTRPKPIETVCQCSYPHKASMYQDLLSFPGQNSTPALGWSAGSRADSTGSLLSEATYKKVHLPRSISRKRA